MIASGEAQLLVAHPGHELLLHGWISQSKPIVQVLTDGSGHSAVGRLEMTAEFLRAVGALPGAIFGRLSDREAYAMIIPRLSRPITTQRRSALSFVTEIIAGGAAPGEERARSGLLLTSGLPQRQLISWRKFSRKTCFRKKSVELRIRNFRS